MTFKPAIWYPISVVLSVVNVGAAWFAARETEPCMPRCTRAWR